MSRQEDTQAKVNQDASTLAAGGGGTGSNLYIGVGNDYKTTTYPYSNVFAALGVPGVQPQNINQPTLNPPQYKTGADDSILGKMSPDEVFNLQLGLNKAGLLDSFSPKTLDKGTRAAFLQLLTEANITGRPWTDILSDHIQHPKVKTKTGTKDMGDIPNVIELTNPADIAASFKTVARTLLGQDPSQDEVDKFIGAYHAQETMAQNAKYAAQYAQGPEGQVYGPGGTVTNAPGSAGLAEQAEAVTRFLHPNEVFAESLNRQLGGVMGALLGGSPASVPGGGGG